MNSIVVWQSRKIRFLTVLLSVAVLFVSATSHANENARATNAAAHWVTPNEFWLRPETGTDSVFLTVRDFGRSQSQSAPEADESLSGSDRSGSDSPGFERGSDVRIELQANPPGTYARPAGLDETFHAYSAAQPVTEKQAGQWITGAVEVLQESTTHGHLSLSQVQTPRLLDWLYTRTIDDADEVVDYGASVTPLGLHFKVWAPTARAVTLLLHNPGPGISSEIPMRFDDERGLWYQTAKLNDPLAYYQYEVSVYQPDSGGVETRITTDPWSLSLSINSEYSQVVDLDDAGTQPDGWVGQRVPTVLKAEDSILYEVHIRDFSAFDEALSDPDFRGTYKAFGDKKGNGYRHLQRLSQAGVTHIHLLPAFDLASINEDAEQTLYPQDSLAKLCQLDEENPVCSAGHPADSTIQELLESFDPASADAQAVVSSIRTMDAYNWGYDPFHYTVPEGSYATNPEGVARIVEFREMVQSLHGQGFRVVMDVVYNHTFAAGLGSRSVLDKIVPGYFHRRQAVSGDIETSTCCPNTATEHAMMAKLMIDSLMVWARDYKIDGFRFDLMGHQPKALMLHAREQVRTIDPDTYFYGEGWNFGEVANNRLFVQATQTEMAGTELGTFTDRLRDAVRGGSYDSAGEGIRSSQGLGNGLLNSPNELQPETGVRARYQLAQDQLRLGLAGNLEGFILTNHQGQQVSGNDIPYGDGFAGYARDPADSINYVSKHDNQTLWDNHQYRIPFQTSKHQRVRMQVLSLAYPILAQGIPFIHMGSEMLRSKSFTRDSYDFGDWFNRVDFTYQSNNYRVGLPPADTDEGNWPVINSVLNGNQGRDQVEKEDIEYAVAATLELIAIRSASPLLRMGTARQIVQQVRFLNTGVNAQDGLIVMQVSAGKSGQPTAERGLVVIFNQTLAPLNFPYPATGFTLHPIQAQGIDDLLISGASAGPQGFTVPALSAAVFVEKPYYPIR